MKVVSCHSFSIHLTEKFLVYWPMFSSLYSLEIYFFTRVQNMFTYIYIYIYIFSFFFVFYDKVPH